MRKLIVGITAAAALALAAPLAAQETGTPVFKSPYRTFTTSEIGASFSDGEGYEWALEGFYGYGRGPWDVGLRAGYMSFGDGAVDEGGFLLGADARTRVVNSSESFPLDGALTLGVGTVIDGGTVVFLPIGISLGRRVLLEGSETSFVPYVHPVLTPVLGSDSDDDLNFTLGLGVDIKFTRNLDIRVAGALGDGDGVSIGFAIIR
ncbi:MAG TPA: outer membrane beta-barrel protein [Gemmatimonadales bacterium]|nr:outer membrane beta-barrel protein [Gemmatimonadales bacterium]